MITLVRQLPESDHATNREDPAPAPDEDRQFWADIMFGILVGTPATYLISAIIGIVAGVGVGNSLALAFVPALFCGTYLGGMIPMTRRLIRRENEEALQRRAVTASAAHPAAPLATPWPAAA